MNEPARSRRFTQILRAMAHPVRRDILTRVRSGELPVSRIAASYRVSPAAISRHLKVLAGVGLVKARRQGRNRLISANPPGGRNGPSEA